MACLAKHTKYQPGDEDWKCPQCGGGNDVFFVDDPVEEAPDDCGLVHDADGIVCSKCDLYWTGKKVTALMAKRFGLVECPCCKGRGMVPKDK